ncbi:putative U3 small nucleolar RNA-associated protein [Lachnellula willkommii]|uniref:Putative U3 small nucleolar RNA-associated protein n=1 Tax=Lachnellula willkommii TaxID=215461 RepID=A0A559M0Q4_9HELO|nr:putative U3 small nucleolar RNA-associated protein [Lachnellula willkommii]
MSSMRNAVQRRNHRERGQPEERKKWGLLEKSKDYKLRAADHKVKKTKLKQLKQKVLDKNPDEFYCKPNPYTQKPHLLCELRSQELC